VGCAKTADQFAVWVVDSGGLKEAQVQSYSLGSASVLDHLLLWGL